MTTFGRNIPKGTRTVTRSVGGRVDVRFTGPDLTNYAIELRSMAHRSQNLQAPFDAWGQYLVETLIPRQFSAQGTPKKWAKLKEPYASWKRKHFGNLPILVLTGKMRAGFTWEAGPRSLKVSNAARYWQYHQDGTQNMVARPVLQISKDDRAQLTRIVFGYLIGQTQGAGL